MLTSEWFLVCKAKWILVHRVKSKASHPVTAWISISFCSDGLEDIFDSGPCRLRATWHQRRTISSTLFSTTNTATDEEEPFLTEGFTAPLWRRGKFKWDMKILRQLWNIQDICLLTCIPFFLVTGKISSWILNMNNGWQIFLCFCAQCLRLNCSSILWFVQKTKKNSYSVLFWHAVFLLLLSWPWIVFG